MTIFKNFCAKFLRRRANLILKRFPIFRLSTDEYFKNCYALERNFAGIVVGYPIPSVVIKIVPIQRAGELEDVEPVSLGYFGEIVYRQNKQDWQVTSLCGFADQRGRIWCCGNIADIVEYAGETYSPYCIEPVFESLFFVHKTRLIRMPTGAPGLKVQTTRLLNWKFLQKYWKILLLRFANRFEKTKTLHEVFFE